MEGRGGEGRLRLKFLYSCAQTKQTGYEIKVFMAAGMRMAWEWVLTHEVVLVLWLT